MLSGELIARMEARTAKSANGGAKYLAEDALQALSDTAFEAECERVLELTFSGTERSIRAQEANRTIALKRYTEESRRRIAAEEAAKAAKAAK